MFYCGSQDLSYIPYQTILAFYHQIFNHRRQIIMYNFIFIIVKMPHQSLVHQFIKQILKFIGRDIQISFKIVFSFLVFLTTSNKFFQDFFHVSSFCRIDISKFIQSFYKIGSNNVFNADGLIIIKFFGYNIFI